jgi:hemoglobin
LIVGVTRQTGPVAQSLFERVGGEPFFVTLVDHFYESVALDPDLLALYPEQDDLAGARWRLSHFLVQYFGGPTTYSDQRGHPRLRLRHAPFPVDELMRDRWLKAMADAMAQMELHELDRGQIWGYFVAAADAMRNQPG